MWVILGIFSSFFLGFHEIFKKAALNGNAVLPVLFTGTASGAAVFVPLLLISSSGTLHDSSILIHIPQQNLQAHLFFLLKSVIVTCAWLFSYFSVKHLPVTVLAPVNASGPVWTLLGALLIYGERLNVLQWSGVLVCLCFYFLLSLTGRQGQKSAGTGRWLWFAFLGILFNSASALLDKYLVRHFDRVAMQAWFSVYAATLFFLILLVFWYPSRASLTRFTWRWSAVLIGLFLVVADFLYFRALSLENSLVSILIVIRRASAVLVFAAGAVYFRETSLQKRALMLAGILSGVVMIILGSE